MKVKSADKVKLLKEEIARLISYADSNIELLKGSDHPQHKEMFIKNSGYKIALEDLQSFMILTHI